MSQSQGETGKVRAVLFAMRCRFSGPVLDALSAAQDVDLAAVVLPGRTPERDPIRACGSPVFDVPNRSSLADPAFRSWLKGLSPEVIIVACFPWRLPRWVLELPARACLNVHPSLLPEGRGPEPVFWAFQRGRRETGVTVHLMDDAFDAGPIIAQWSVPILDGATIPSLELALARIGAEMALDLLRTPADRRAAPVPQRERDAWYAPMPRAEDLVVPTSWDADRAARFIHAVTPVYGPVPVLVLATGQRLMVGRVLGIGSEHEDDRTVIVDGDIARVRFASGTLSFRIAHGQQTLQLHP